MLMLQVTILIRTELAWPCCRVPMYTDVFTRLGPPKRISDSHAPLRLCRTGSDTDPHAPGRWCKDAPTGATMSRDPIQATESSESWSVCHSPNPPMSALCRATLPPAWPAAAGMQSTTLLSWKVESFCKASAHLTKVWDRASARP